MHCRGIGITHRYTVNKTYQFRSLTSYSTASLITNNVCILCRLSCFAARDLLFLQKYVYLLQQYQPIIRNSSYSTASPLTNDVYIVQVVMFRHQSLSFSLKFYLYTILFRLHLWDYTLIVFKQSLHLALANAHAHSLLIIVHFRPLDLLISKSQWHSCILPNL